MRLYSVATSIVLFNLLANGEDHGKVYLKSEPSGAEVFQAVKDGDKEVLQSLGKTPVLVNVSLGRQKLVFKAAGYEDATLELNIVNTEIQKPDSIRLQPTLYNLDVIFEEGWGIYVNKQTYIKENKPVATPATIRIPAGRHEIGLAKQDYRDILISVDVAKNETLEVKDKPTKGVSNLISKSTKKIDHSAEPSKKPDPSTTLFNSEQSLKFLKLNGGEWSIKNNELVGTCQGDRQWATIDVVYKQIYSVTIVAKIVSPSKNNLRLFIGPVHAILNWEGANENHYRNGNRSNRHVTTPHVLEPGKEAELVIRANNNQILLTINGTEQFKSTGKLDGTISFQAALGSTIAIKSIKIEGEIDVAKKASAETRSLP